MPPAPITLPDLGTDRATLSVWYVHPGERVFAGDRVAEVLIPGATVDVPAPASGVLREALVGPNAPLTAGQTLGTLDPDPDD